MVMPCSRSAARPSTSKREIYIPGPACRPFLESDSRAGELVFEDHLGIVEQVARSASICRHRREPQVMKRSIDLVLVLVEIGVDVLGDERFGDVNGVKCVGHFGPFLFPSRLREGLGVGLARRDIRKKEQEEEGPTPNPSRKREGGRG